MTGWANELMLPVVNVEWIKLYDGMDWKHNNNEEDDCRDDRNMVPYQRRYYEIPHSPSILLSAAFYNSMESDGFFNWSDYHLDFDYKNIYSTGRASDRGHQVAEIISGGLRINYFTFLLNRNHVHFVWMQCKEERATGNSYGNQRFTIQIPSMFSYVKNIIMIIPKTSEIIWFFVPFFLLSVHYDRV